MGRYNVRESGFVSEAEHLEKRQREALANEGKGDRRFDVVRFGSIDMLAAARAELAEWADATWERLEVVRDLGGLRSSADAPVRPVGWRALGWIGSLRVFVWRRVVAGELDAGAAPCSVVVDRTLGLGETLREAAGDAIIGAAARAVELAQGLPNNGQRRAVAGTELVEWLVVATGLTRTEAAGRLEERLAQRKEEADRFLELNKVESWR